jgi:archaeal flagellin FlaB
LQMYKSFKRNQKGITGLETAIILIAFVVVAAVFAYTTLSSGLFATQKAQEAAYSGLQEAQSSIELKSPVILTANTTGSTGKVQQISFCVSNLLGGNSIDFTPPTANTSGNSGLAAQGSSNKVVINYIDPVQTVNDLYWTVDALGEDDGDYILEKNEKFEITVGSSQTSSDGGNLVDALTTASLSINTKFSIIVSTPAGAILTIERTTPGSIDKIMNLR